MKRFFGIFRREYDMMIRRKGIWLAYALIFLMHGLTFLSPRGGALPVMSSRFLWRTAGEILWVLNLFAPLVGGIAAADRLVRDGRLGVRELLRGAPMGNGPYLLGKYAGVLAGALTPLILFVLALGTAETIIYKLSPVFLPSLVAAFLTISLPAYAFVIACSLAFPLVLPLRVYQVMFTGYWFWGNYLNPKVVPTLNGTILTPGGIFALQGFFGGTVSFSNAAARHSAAEASASLIALFACAAAALGAAAWLMARRERNA